VIGMLSVCAGVCVLPGGVELHEDIFGVVDDDVLEGAALRDHNWSCSVLGDDLLCGRYGRDGGRQGQGEREM
jgi:hypothetical protein